MKLVDSQFDKNDKSVLRHYKREESHRTVSGGGAYVITSLSVGINGICTVWHSASLLPLKKVIHLLSLSSIKCSTISGLMPKEYDISL